jgi:acetyl esterase/lipase
MCKASDRVAGIVAVSRSPSELGAFFEELAAWADVTGPAAETHRYGTHADQELDLRLPEGDGPHRVAFVLHGGFWRPPFTRGNTSAIAVALTRAGWATANAEYRRLGPGAYRTMLEDVAAARAALHELDAALDLSRVTAIGHSAGGHLALWLAARGGANTVLALAGVCDLEDAAREGLGRRATQEFLGGTPAEVPDAYELADPARRVPFGVRQVLAHGTADDRVPFAHAERYCERARAAGDDCSVLALDGVDHFDVIDPRTDAWRQIVAAL